MQNTRSYICAYILKVSDFATGPTGPRPEGPNTCIVVYQYSHLSEHRKVPQITENINHCRFPRSFKKSQTAVKGELTQ